MIASRGRRLARSPWSLFGAGASFLDIDGSGSLDGRACIRRAKPLTNGQREAYGHRRLRLVNAGNVLGLALLDDVLRGDAQLLRKL